MGEHTEISWCDHTFNPWIGCAKVSPACTNCYAEVSTPARTARARGLELWGPKAERRVTSDTNWREPLRWNRAAERNGRRSRVFCASLADVFEDRPNPMPGFHYDDVLRKARARLWRLIFETPHLDWLLLTKRPENADRLATQAWGDEWGYATHDDVPVGPWLSNVWLGTTVEDQRRADERIPHLLATPAAVRFLSCEPLLGPVDLRGWGDAAPAAPDESLSGASWSSYSWEEWVPPSLRKLIEDFWSESYGRGPAAWLRDHAVQRVPESGARVVLAAGGHGWLKTEKMATDGVRGRYVHLWNNIGRVVTDAGEIHPASGGHGSGWLSRWYDKGDYRPRLHWVIVGGESGPGARPLDLAWARSIAAQCRDARVPCFVKQMGARPIEAGDPTGRFRTSPATGEREYEIAATRLVLRDRKGGDIAEWPEDLRVREFPEVRRG